MTYTQTTFTFGGVNINTIITNIMIPDIRRPLRPPVTKQKIEIPGRDGSWDFGPGDKRDFNIEVDFTINAASSTALMGHVRDLAAFLDGKKELVFTDDVGKGYLASVYAQILLNKRVFSRTQSGTIVFECDATTLSQLNVLVYDDTSTDAIGSATVKIFEGHGNTAGTPLKEGTTGSDGYCLVGLLKPGAYTLQGIASGYTTGSNNITMGDEFTNAWIALVATI